MAAYGHPGPTPFVPRDIPERLLVVAAKSIAKWNYTAFLEEYKLGEKQGSTYILAEF